MFSGKNRVSGENMFPPKERIFLKELS